ncbi:MAG: glycosyltransferase [Chryseobacterium taeanense]
MKKRILFRITPADKGMIQQLIPIIKNIDDNTFDISLLLNYKDKNLLQEIPADIDVRFLVKTKSTMSQKTIFYLFLPVIRFLQLQFYWFFPSRIKHKIRKIPDIEIAFTPSSLRGLLKSPFKNSRKIFWLDGNIIDNYTADHGRGLIRMMYRCNATVFGSLHAREAFEDYFGFKIPRSLYIHPYINKEKVLVQSSQRSILIEDQFSGDTKVFVSVGSLTYDKGYDALLAAHAELLLDGFNHKVVVIGDGNEYESLRKMIHWLNVEDSFLLVGKKSNPYPYIQAADYYIQPSRYEAYPVILNEVVALNKPIISTATGSVGELLGQWKTAYLIEFDTSEIKEAMKKFLCDGSLVKTIEEEQQKFDFHGYNKTICDQITDLFLTI